MYCTCKSVRALKEKPMKLHTFLLTMIPLIPHIFSLTTIIVFSLAYSDGSDAKAGDVAQPLVERPRADTPDGLGNYALGLDPTGEADDWKKIADTSNDRTGQVVVIVAEPNNHGCSNTNKRRREIGRSCSFDQALSEFRPSSAQEKKPKSQGQFRNTRQRKKEATPEGSATPVSSQDLNCPSDSWAVCGANELIQNYLNPGNFREVPWLLDNIPPIIELQRFCRYWFPQNQCDTTDGRELPMCCKRVELRSSEFPVETLDPFARAYMLQYPYLGFFCEPLAGITLLP